MGFVIMPLEKLHALFGLILMTQDFSQVSTSVSLLSSSKSSLSPSLSDLATSSSSKSLLLSPSSHSSSQSSTHVLWPSPSSRQQHHKNLHSHSYSSGGADMPFSHHHFHPATNTKLSSLMLEKKVPIKISHNSKHQKRHAGEENNSNHGNRAVGERERVGEGDASVTTHQEAHLLTTSSPSIELSVNNSPSTTTFRINSTKTDRGDNNRDERNRDFRGKCRHKSYLPPNAFELDTCAWCYKYMRDDLSLFGIPSKKLKDLPSRILDPHTNETYWIRTLFLNGTKVS